MKPSEKITELFSKLTLDERISLFNQLKESLTEDLVEAAKEY